MRFRFGIPEAPAGDRYYRAVSGRRHPRCGHFLEVCQLGRSLGCRGPNRSQGGWRPDGAAGEEGVTWYWLTPVSASPSSASHDVATAGALQDGEPGPLLTRDGAHLRAERPEDSFSGRTRPDRERVVHEVPQKWPLGPRCPHNAGRSRLLRGCSRPIGQWQRHKEEFVDLVGPDLLSHLVQIDTRRRLNSRSDLLGDRGITPWGEGSFAQLLHRRRVSARPHCRNDRAHHAIPGGLTRMTSPA
jgi:hypothetical protein